MISNVLRDLDEAGIIISGLLKTEIDQDHSDITGKDGQYQEVLLPEWRNLNRFPWFSPTLNYGGELTIQRQDADFVVRSDCLANLVLVTRFSASFRHGT